jgi:hypothetical protein
MAAALAGAGVALATGWGLGRGLIRRSAPAWAHLAAGLAVYSVLLFVLASFHLLKPVAVLVLMVAALVFGRRFAAPGERGPSSHGVWLLIPFALLYLAHALTPEIQADGLSYHLSLPMEARRTGGFPSAISFYNVLPLGTETLFAAAFGIGGEAAAKLLHLALLAASLPLLAAIGRLLGLPDWSGWLAGAFYAVTPVTAITATSTYNDAALVYFMLAAFYWLLRWRESQDSASAWAVGLCAGFCYAIKFTGGLVAPAAALAMAIGSAGAAARVLVGAAAIAGPWLARNVWRTGNPFAPLLNHYFPNAWFHAETEQKLGQFLRNYGSVSWDEIPLEVTVYGEALAGLLGPVWLLAPLALLALRGRAGRILCLAAAIAAIPFALNHGARFLMPALPFAALAWVGSLPRSGALLLVAIHCLLSWPAVTEWYAAPGAWRLEAIPWRAALGMEDGEAYRQRNNAESQIARMVEKHTKPRDGVLDLADVPAAISRRTMTNYWQTAAGDSLFQGIRLGMTPDRGALSQCVIPLDGSAVERIRIEVNGPLPTSWAVHEIQLADPAGNPVLAGRGWWFEASHHVEETPHAMDGNLTSMWATWDSSATGAFLEVTLPSPRPIGSVRVISNRPAEIRVNGSPGKCVPLPGLNLRGQAITAVRKSSISYIVARVGNDAVGRIGADMADRPQEWGLKPIDSVQGATLYSVGR